MGSEFEKLIVLLMNVVCVVALGGLAVFATATVRAYRNGQIPLARMVTTLIFLLVCFGLPVLILLSFYPRPVS